jgi:hypothetical protein
MNFQFIQIAEAATMKELMNSVNKVIINPLIMFMFALAVTYFLYGLVKYLISPDNEEIRKTNKQHMLWGIFGMFIMIAVFGIMNIILTTVGEKDINIDNGTYTISK